MMLMLAAEPPDEQEGLRRGCASVTRRAMPNGAAGHAP
jgi:hypothetical protein